MQKGGPTIYITRYKTYNQQDKTKYLIGHALVKVVLDQQYDHSDQEYVITYVRTYYILVGYYAVHSVPFLISCIT